MFKIAVQTGDLDYDFGLDNAYRMIAEAGFDAVDANIDHLQSYKGIIEKKLETPFLPTTSEKEMLAYFKPWKDAAKKYGLDNYQAHAPFPSLHTFEKDKEWNDQLIDMLKRTIVGCASIDCHNLIIHPFFMDYDHRMTREEEWNVNVESYMKLAKTAMDNDVTIHLENMFTGRKGKLYAACCNNGLEAARYIDTLNEAAGKKCFAFCLDTGHALIASQDVRQFMLDLGDRLTCFHVHDNDGANDNHQAPYWGKLDWEAFTDGLAMIGFDKTLSFETFNACKTVDKELVPETLKYIASCGRMFDRKAQKKKEELFR